jgi:hypothetical protein
MYLVELLLPVADNEGKPFSDDVYAAIRQQLIDTFGGLTAYGRAPAMGVWADNGAQQHDDIVVIEVMTETLDRAWWAAFRRKLERDLRQKEILIRANRVERL